MASGLGPDPNSLQQVPATITGHGPLTGPDIQYTGDPNYSPFQGYSPQSDIHHTNPLLVIGLIILVLFVLTLIAVRMSSGRAKAAA